MIWPIITLAIAQETDIVLTRQRARQIATLLGFDVHDQTRLTTAVSEIARNAFEHGGGGRVEFRAIGQDETGMIEICVADQGKGMANLEAVLLGQHESQNGMGIGLRGARRLMDDFSIESTPGHGTTVTMRKALPRKSPRLTTPLIARLTGALTNAESADPMAEVRRQNQELMVSLEEITGRQEELERVNQELEDTNRGVVALYGELDERADHLRKADEVKTRFLSNMSHEVRTPINSILALSRMLIERLDGGLNDEQDKQVRLIRSAAETLSELVDDMLDLAKAEAGKIEIRPAPFVVEDLFSALRGMMRPLLTNAQVALIFDDASTIPRLRTDESKVAQILRNLVSNAVKFTEQGEIVVSAELAADGSLVVFRVRDTGIGIAPNDQARIFEEYAQIDSPLQRKVKGSGLGLPLSKRLAELLGGRLELDSAPGVGSVFTLTLPCRLTEPAPPPTGWVLEPGRIPVLLIEDGETDAMVLTRYLQDTRYQLATATTIEAARHALAAVQPRAILLDVMLEGEQCWPFLIELKRGWATRDIPLIVIASSEDERRARGMGADDYARKPIDRDWLIATLDRLVVKPSGHRVLIVDDDMRSRYVLRRMLTDASCQVSEAAWGFEGVRRAREEQPDLMLLDLMMPDIDGYEVLELLDEDERTRAIPVIVITSAPAAQIDRARLTRAAAIVGKDQLSKERFEAMVLSFSRATATALP